MLDALHLARIIVEICSAVACAFLVRFMVKPYLLTRESRYLGLPLGFAFLGTSYAVAAVAYTEPFVFFTDLLWLQFLARTFSFVFIATTYFFSKRPSKNTRLLWNATLSVLVVTLIVSFLAVIISPEVVSGSIYSAIQLYVRFFNVVCLAYVAFHTLRSYAREPDPKSMWTPAGFVLFAIGQFSLLFWYSDSNLGAFLGALVFRLTALAIFLSVSYLAFNKFVEKG